ncbi:hypothetical protein E2C01_005343 [Portunus trituberculatus]|uniref:Uncharacterized protein n=1 Tax=Portunus trituberculatus TaxID=210409 RepID=A0A5B7CT40_PORTR|nr:hypothetical protein [Portunus trituberculatus]
MQRMSWRKVASVYPSALLHEEPTMVRVLETGDSERDKEPQAMEAGRRRWCGISNIVSCLRKCFAVVSPTNPMSDVNSVCSTSFSLSMTNSVRQKLTVRVSCVNCLKLRL